MALNKRHMQTILMRNGHLKVTGEESTDELRMALLYLRSHTIVHCRKAHLGIPIEVMLPDISVVTAKSIRSSNARKIADIEDIELKAERRV